MLGFALTIASLAAVAWLGPPREATFKVATWNVRSGMDVQGFGATRINHDTLNCSDHTKPLNAWGIGLPQQQLARIRDDPAIVALAVQEAWNCGRPDNLNSVLRFKTATPERNGVALIARHGFAGDITARRIGGTGYDSWIVGGRVCLDAACSATVPVFSTHWGAREAREWPLQARNVVDFMATQPRPHIVAGDLNVFRIDRWNPKVPCTNDDSVHRSAALDAIEHAGFIDAWKATQGKEGWTGMTNRQRCGTPAGNVYKRIDYVFANQLRVVGTALFARTAPGTDAPSDHLGLIAELALGPNNGRD